MFSRTIHDLILAGELSINTINAQVYLAGERAALIVPECVNIARAYLKGSGVTVPANERLYGILRDRGLAEVQGWRVVHRVRVHVGSWSADLSAVILERRLIVSEEEASRLRRDVSFELLSAASCVQEGAAREGAVVG